MANEEHLSILEHGIAVWNKWRKAHPEIKPDLSDADLSDADLSQAHLSRANLSHADLIRAALKLVDLSRANLSQADLSHADLSDANLTLADLREAALSHADLSGTALNLADLSQADLSQANLRRADLHMADLSRANLSRVTLNQADLRRADLRRADLSRANLSHAEVSHADLSDANLRGTNLSDANLSKANLRMTDFSMADFSGADLTQANIGWTLFGNIDLSEVKGLETLYHLGPSTIGIDTITRSQGKIPEVFLKGAGVPDIFITYMQSLTAEVIKFYSCFISYSTKDQAFAERLHNDLQAKGVRCWFTPQDIQGGKKIHEQIDHAIRLHDKLLVILSEHGMDSEWVKTEIYNARQQEVKENRRKLFPISLVEYEQVRQWTAFDADIGKDMAREVREYYIPDFTHWKDHDAYQKAFDRLLRDLKAQV